MKHATTGGVPKLWNYRFINNSASIACAIKSNAVTIIYNISLIIDVLLCDNFTTGNY